MSVLVDSHIGLISFLEILTFNMEKECRDELYMSSTTFPLAPKFKLPMVFFPLKLKNALKKVYNLEEKFIPKSKTEIELYDNYIKLIKSLSNIRTINKENYLVLLKICLYLIQFETDLEIKKFNLLNHTIKKSCLENCFVISIQISNLDFKLISSYCEVRIYPTDTKKGIRCKIVKIQGNDVIIKPSLDKHISILENENNKYNINFLICHWSLSCCHYALSIISKSNWTEIVYPQLKANYIDTQIDIKWINPDIEKNKQQKQAVTKILNKTSCPAPYIIFGPPGTGKTATLVEAICQIVKQYPTRYVLVCTVSNLAADEITKRLIKNIPKKFIYRMYAPSKEWSSVNEEIQSCANFIDKESIFLFEELLLMKKVIVTTLVTSTRLIDSNLKENHFSYIIIDEASQATEPEMLIPFAITKKNFKKETTGFQTQIVIAGDPYQLGPVIRCKRIEKFFGKSMLERLMDDCNIYKKQNEKYDPNYITKLVKNYRSHKCLLHVSNKQFYNGDLKICGGPDTQMALNWSSLPNKNFPMIFQEILGIEERVANQSVYNTTEILAVLIYVDILIKTKFKNYEIKQKDIGIITPFKQQELDIKQHLIAMNWNDITVGTVEIFQGQERKVIILSTVRSKIFKHDDEEHIGFLSNAKRFNVALTRAKTLMIIIGNPNILCSNKHWKELWNYCKENNACIFSDQLPLNKKIVKKFEATSKLIYNNNDMLNSIVSTPTKLEKQRKKMDTSVDVLVSKTRTLKLNDS